MHMKNNSRFWIRTAAFIVSGFQLINNFAARAQTADSFDPRLELLAPGGAHLPPDVRSIAIQADGRFLLGGLFNSIGGVARFDLARFQSDGALETAFRPSTFGLVNQVGVLRDGRILDSNADELNGPSFLRYLSNGATDPSFSISPGSLDDNPWTSLFAPDGSLIAATRPGPDDTMLKRLSPDGSEDFSFLVFFGPPFAEVKSLALQRDGKILVGGIFSSVNGVERFGLVRIDPDGFLDDSFNPNPFIFEGFPGWIDSMAVQSDGKIVVTGGFENIGGRQNIGIARLNPDGTADPGFTASFGHCCHEPSVSSIALQADGKIILGGSFTTFNDQPALNVARLNPDGSLDTSFNPALDNDVTGLALDTNGRLLVSGCFTQVGDQSRAGMARLLNTGPATESLSYQGTTVTWLRGGTAPDVWTTTFELSTDGSTWTLLGEGAPVAGGWGLTGVSAPLGSRIRARGFIASGYRNASQGMVESVSTVSLRILSGNLAPPPFGFALAGPANQSVVIEGSTNLQDWIPLHTNSVPSSGLLLFTDPHSITLTQRFYRGRAE